MSQNVKTAAAAAGASTNAASGPQDFTAYYQQIEAEKSRYFAEVASRKQAEAKKRAERGA